jgi:uncharacterized protein YndB with AHSA1/START domain
MAKSSVVHATFVVERTFNASPAEVFNAFADPKAKAQWFVGPKEWESSRFRWQRSSSRLPARERASS